MPTNQTVYNSRLTSEALEKRFRDTFTSQGGAELVDDLYASGVIVPVVDFTAAAEGDFLPLELSSCLDYSITPFIFNNSSGTIVNTAGFYSVRVNVVLNNNTNTQQWVLQITDGTTPKTFLDGRSVALGQIGGNSYINYDYIVYLRSGDSITGNSTNTSSTLTGYTRQIADVNGNIVNPTGFTSS